MIRVLGPSLLQEGVERLRIRLRRQRAAMTRASSTIRGHLSGVFTTRRIEHTPALLKVRAIAPFAATMKFSINSLARFLVWC